MYIDKESKLIIGSLILLWVLFIIYYVAVSYEVTRLEKEIDNKDMIIERYEFEKSLERTCQLSSVTCDGE